MSFGENLLYLRKKENITQEQLAERMEVSRQTVSKWESDASYPEMDKILTLCEMFDCNMDALLRGSVETFDREDKVIYENHMNDFSRKIAGSISALIAGTGLAALAEGFKLGETVETLVFFSIAIIAIVLLVVTGIQHGEFVERYPVMHLSYSQEERDEAARKFPIRIGTGIGLILMGVLWGGVADGIGLQEGILGCIFLLFVAAGTGFLIYGAMQREKYDIEKYNRENSPSEEDKQRKDRIGKYCGCIMILAALIYLMLGLLKNAWDTAWVVFIAGGMLCGIVAVALGKSDS